MANTKSYTVDGITVELEQDILTKWSVAELIDEINSGNTFASVKLVKKILGENYPSYIALLDPEEGEPSVETVMGWMTSLLKVLSEDEALKN